MQRCLLVALRTWETKLLVGVPGCSFGAFIQCFLGAFVLLSDDSLLALKFVANVMATSGSHVMSCFLPRCSHLVCSSLLSVIKRAVTQSCAQSFVLDCCSGAGAAVSSTASTASGGKVPRPPRPPLPGLPLPLIANQSEDSCISLTLSDTRIGLLLMSDAEQRSTLRFQSPALGRPSVVLVGLFNRS